MTRKPCETRSHKPADFWLAALTKPWSWFGPQSIAGWGSERREAEAELCQQPGLPLAGTCRPRKLQIASGSQLFGGYSWTIEA